MLQQHPHFHAELCSLWLGWQAESSVCSRDEPLGTVLMAFVWDVWHVQNIF